MAKFKKEPLEVEMFHAHFYGTMETPEGTRFVEPGQWIVTGINEEQYPIPQKIAEETYGRNASNREAQEYWDKHQRCKYAVSSDEDD